MQRKHSYYIIVNDIFLFCQQFLFLISEKKSYEQVNQNIKILYERERQNSDNANLKKFLWNKILIFLCCHKQSLLEWIYPRRHHGIGHPKVYYSYQSVAIRSFIAMDSWTPLLLSFIMIRLLINRCYLKLKTIHMYFLCPFKRQISMLRFIALRGARANKNVANLQHR